MLKNIPLYVVVQALAVFKFAKILNEVISRGTKAIIWQLQLPFFSVVSLMFTF